MKENEKKYNLMQVVQDALDKITKETGIECYLSQRSYTSNHQKGFTDITWRVDIDFYQVIPDDNGDKKAEDKDND